MKVVVKWRWLAKVKDGKIVIPESKFFNPPEGAYLIVDVEIVAHDDSEVA